MTVGADGSPTGADGMPPHPGQGAASGSLTSSTGGAELNPPRIFRRSGFYTGRVLTSAILVLWLVIHGFPATGLGAESVPGDDFPFDKTRFQWEWGGHLKQRIAATWPNSGSAAAANGVETQWDAVWDLRLKGSLSLWDNLRFEAHNESLFLASETAGQGLHADDVPLASRNSASVFTGGSSTVPDDRCRLMDLTWTWEPGEPLVVVNRFDRLSAAYRGRWGSVTVGRQAITWGNGMLFNPFDLFTPFAPTTLDREYKQGEDAVSLQLTPGDRYGDGQFLLVPRREPVSRDLRWDQASLAGKYRRGFEPAQSELTVLAGKHFDDAVVGVGATAQAGGAVWRVNVLYTALAGGEYSDFVSLVANVDYGWTWWGLNAYGWLEAFYSGVGVGPGDYGEALSKAPLAERLERGELFVLGRHYLDAALRLEVHPLVNLYVTAIMNLQDPSGIVQPYVVWDAIENVQVHLAATLFWGDSGTEFGGFDLSPASLFDTRPPNSLLAWITWHF